MQRGHDAGSAVPLQDTPTLLGARFNALIWACLDAELLRSAVFYAERYFAHDRDNPNHDARHLYATALMRAGQTHSAMHLVTLAQQVRCSGCAEIKAKCYTSLGRHREARLSLEESLCDGNFIASASTSVREVHAFPEEAILHCRAGQAALKANLHEKASSSFRQALSLNPMLWEAFEGLCAIGSFPEIDELFPERPPPIKQTADDVFANVASSSKAPHTNGPIATGAGFFTPDPQNNVFRGWKPDPAPPQPFRMCIPAGPHDSIATIDSFHPADNSIMGALLRPPRGPVPSATGPLLRPLSSADEAGPAPKKPRSLSRTVGTAEAEKFRQAGAGADARPKKARPRPVLISSNVVSQPSQPTRRTQPAATATRNAKNDATANNALGSRRSTRLLSGAAKHVVKHPPQRERRRQPTHQRTRSAESETDHGGLPPSPPSAAHSPRSEGSPVPGAWTIAQEQAAQERYEIARAELYIYDLMRLFASSVRALATYDCLACLEELDRLPERQQRSATVMAMVGRARYEMADYVKAERFFGGARSLEPYRLWDMEVYSTTLWHLQRNVQLSFLAQELLAIDGRSPQAWIAAGNCFSLQKERAQALTCFRRAATLDPSCAYAYTLSGHECIEEDLEKAISYFQSALRADPRHYNAWYGLGVCYMKMSKNRLAEYHYRKASEIHPQSAVLLGCVGMALERRGEREEAFALYDEAVRLCPDNALVRYRRAKLLIGMKKYEAAISDLQWLRELTPEESNVVFQLARVYRLLGNETKSAQTLALARDMSPKSLNKIKRLLETEKEVAEGASMEDG